MQTRKKILFVTEASYTNSGFGVYANELIKRIHAMDKYDIAEFATYGYTNDPRDRNVKWRFYANAVHDNHPRYKQYNSNTTNQFGLWRLNKVLLDFCPDICIATRDPWMDFYINDSPLRRFFHWVEQPTYDSTPYRNEWIDTLLHADGVLSYTDWSFDCLKKEGGGKIKLYKPNPLGVDLNLFSPTKNLKKHRAKWNLGDDLFIIGTVMRNQKRKLYPDLLHAFRQYLQICKDNGKDELAQKSYLYIHTSFPDLGWHLPQLLNETELGYKVIFSYVCRACKKAYCSFFQDARTVCPFCNSVASVLPSVGEGFIREQLAEVYQLFDVYVQYATCLGKDECILTKQGWKSIPQLKLGDLVFTHKHQWKPIINIWKNLPHSSKQPIKKISIHSDYETLVATNNHKFYCIQQKDFPKGNRSLREKIGNDLRNNKLHYIKLLCNKNIQPLSQLRIGDILIYPIDNTVEDKKYLDLKEYSKNTDTIESNIIKLKYGNTYPRYIKIDNDFCKFLGLYVADGNATMSGGMKITCHKNEKENITLANNIFNRFGNSTLRKYPSRKAIDVMFHSKLHQHAFLSMCKKKKEKQFPCWILNLPLEKQKNILIGLFMGDGCYYKQRNISSFSTISEQLAIQIKYILRRLRINYNISISKRDKYTNYDNYNRQKQYRFEIRGNIASGEFDTQRSNSRNVYIDNYHLLQIKNIEEIDYQDGVWNIEVQDDHTMTTKIGVTPQCEGIGIPMLEAAASGIPIMGTDFTAISDVVRNTYGIPLKVERIFHEHDTRSLRALPSNDYLAKQLYKYFTKDEQFREKNKKRARQGAEKEYNWDKNARIWSEYFDSVELTGLQGKWNTAPPNFRPEPSSIPSGLSNVKFINWLFRDLLGQPEKLNTYSTLSVLRDLNYGASTGGSKPKSINREMIFKSILNRVKEHNIAEKIRCGHISLPQEDFIEYAHMKEQLNK